jgi:hypothetical protein
VQGGGGVCVTTCMTQCMTQCMMQAWGGGGGGGCKCLQPAAYVGVHRHLRPHVGGNVDDGSTRASKVRGADTLESSPKLDTNLHV